jgi:hypothetical protein
MKNSILAAAFALCAVSSVLADDTKSGQSPADHLPAHITRLTSFGERADWSADGKRILFLSKTFGDALELDLATRAIRNLTAFYPHHGYTRALYLQNGDILLVGPEEFDPKQAARARWNTFVYVLDKSGKKPPVPLGIRLNEGPAVSRHKLHFAWAEWSDPTPATQGNAGSKLYDAELSYDSGQPKLVNKRLILDSAELPFRCTIEPQNFRPMEENELTFSAYSEAGRKCDVCTVDLNTKKVTKVTDSADVYDEPEGIYPDGSATLVECDSQNKQGPGSIDLWKLSLDGRGTYTRLTYFSEYPTYKASNPVVSDDGHFIAFQMGKSGEAAGVGHGLFLYDLTKAPAKPGKD